LLFKVNYGQNPRIGFEGRRKGKYEAAGKFVEKIKEIQEEVKAVLGKAQEEIKKFVNKKQGEGEEYKAGDLVLLSTKDLKWQMKEKRSEKLTAELPTFAGSKNKMYLHDWLSQIALYCSVSSILADDQKIVCALTRLCAPTSTYMKSYCNKVQAEQGVGSWGNFAQELKNIYRQRDNKEGAKKKLTALWVNKDLAKKNFIKYAE